MVHPLTTFGWGGNSNNSINMTGPTTLYARRSTTSSSSSSSSSNPASAEAAVAAASSTAWVAEPGLSSLSPSWFPSFASPSLPFCGSLSLVWLLTLLALALRLRLLLPLLVLPLYKKRNRTCFQEGSQRERGLYAFWCTSISNPPYALVVPSGIKNRLRWNTKSRSWTT